MLELELPFSGHFRRGERLDTETAKQGDECEPFGSGDNVAALADYVSVEDETFDDLRAGRRGAQSTLAHSLAEFFVINQLSSPFHRGKERGFVESGGWLCLVFFDLQSLGLSALILGDRDDGLVILASGLLAINGKPTGLDENFSIRFESFSLHAGDAGGDFKLRSGIKDRNEAAGDHVVNF